MIRALRLFHARLTGLPIGVWQVNFPAYRARRLHAWRLTAEGIYEYRLLTADEESEYVSREAW